MWILTYGTNSDSYRNEISVRGRIVGTEDLVGDEFADFDNSEDLMARDDMVSRGWDFAVALLNVRIYITGGFELLILYNK